MIKLTSILGPILLKISIIWMQELNAFKSTDDIKLGCADDSVEGQKALNWVWNILEHRGIINGMKFKKPKWQILQLE